MKNSKRTAETVLLISYDPSKGEFPELSFNNFNCQLLN